MDLLREEVERICNANSSTVYDLYFGSSPDGINFAILTTKGLWYKVRVFGNLEGRNVDIPRIPDNADLVGLIRLNMGQMLQNQLALMDNLREENVPVKIIINDTEHLTLDGARNQIEKCKNEIENGLYNSMFSIDSTYFRKKFYFATEELPSDAITNPDAYLMPGDVISTKFIGTTSHYGIYNGNGEVVHVSTHREGINASVARIGRLCPDFVNNDGSIQKKVFSYSLRTPERIVEIARGHADANFRRGRYNLLYRNCQHFVTRCALGLEISPDYLNVNHALNQINEEHMLNAAGGIGANLILRSFI